MATWRDQVALVTGGGRGIGRAIARRLAREGAAVCVNYRERADAAESLVADIRGHGGRAISVAADVADDAAVEGMVDQIAAAFGAVTILVNNAGLSDRFRLENFDAGRLDAMRRVNVDGLIHTTRAVMSEMRRQKYGRIVNITSIAAFGTSLPDNAFYAATKAEAQILTRRFAMELGPFGITVNAVAPGFIDTELARGDADDDAWREITARIGALGMIGRIGDVEDVANAVTFLADPESGFVTAQVLAVDGGRMDYLGH
ncbi:MAG TPA: glucose 1-dehydrogenase [Rhodopila sp.]|uniref:SDR family NAD(P)-dependent oxidoreductase n=1 Tax=Rhodopila sp. TaxID=2480087 RepID=UPI002CC98C23|nr:glucose 1-dehydrogenase [Rhodopila sp.]HVY16805.1 glucose 1-dehydrogenase [Rhodopila sp.]